jgi:hypothetical protein
MKMGYCFQLGGVWLGIHYSQFNKRVCINLIPCCTIWIVFNGGKTPSRRY